MQTFSGRQTHLASSQPSLDKEIINHSPLTICLIADDDIKTFPINDYLHICYYMLNMSYFIILSIPWQNVQTRNKCFNIFCFRVVRQFVGKKVFGIDFSSWKTLRRTNCRYLLLEFLMFRFKVFPGKGSYRWTKSVI